VKYDFELGVKMIQTQLVAFECAALFCWTAFELWGALVNPFVLTLHTPLDNHWSEKREQETKAKLLI
jgi:membrane glycosyltransferase